MFRLHERLLNILLGFVGEFCKERLLCNSSVWESFNFGLTSGSNAKNIHITKEELIFLFEKMNRQRVITESDLKTYACRINQRKEQETYSGSFRAKGKGEYAN
jgi:hypothetical protein